MAKTVTKTTKNTISTKKTKNTVGVTSTRTKSTEKKTTKKKSTSTAGLAGFKNKNLVIVESPAKAKTLEKILGTDYKVLASIGHIRDLPKSSLGIDVENNFEPHYIPLKGKSDTIKKLKSATSVAAKTYLASDPDREGEAIAWHLAYILEMPEDSICRIRMHEITKTGVKKAFDNIDKININLVDAQQARRVLDRLVGYELSPVLWKKVKRGLSAGRVQSVALKILCEREDEIEKFVSQEYWNINILADSVDTKRHYTLSLEKYKGQKIEIGQIGSEKASQEAEAHIRKYGLTVTDFSTKQSKRTPPVPFKTSTLQQEASNKLGFSPRRTMRIAQSLYEGVDIEGRGPTGLITYMRTDSLRLSPEAIASSRDFIKEKFGADYLPDKPRIYTAKENAQDAHEAIRATYAEITPDSIKQFLEPDQYKLYKLIWSRFISSQMADAVVARSVLACESGDYEAKQTGSTIIFKGWAEVYPIAMKEETLAPAIVGEKLIIKEINKEQKWTQHPPRYTEAGLVKILEDKGIGRPSTYAAIIETLVARLYAERSEDKKLVPTDLGRKVNEFLIKNFSDVINEQFTADMENHLDTIEVGTIKWKDLLAKFWSDFKPRIDDVSKNAKPMKIEPKMLGEACPECGKPLLIRTSRFGEFIGCSGYPDCKYTRRILDLTGVKCPKCGKGDVIRKKTAKGRTFYGCSTYPECDYASWKNPLAEKKNSDEDSDVKDEL
ncbi:MAG: type I DNA topoisomerase [Synergistaceae bacterium]|nr:type I DNA topoisomerase [Synergistaceae bacterium]